MLKNELKCNVTINEKRDQYLQQVNIPRLSPSVAMMFMTKLFLAVSKVRLL